MFKISTYDRDGTRSDGGQVRLDEEPDINTLPLTVTDFVNRTESTVVLTQRAASDLMAHLGAFVAST